MIVIKLIRVRIMKRNKYLVIALVTTLLIGCGGGGSSNSGSASSGVAMSVTVATGAPVVGASVAVVDANGLTESCSGVSNSNGVLNCTLNSAKTPPYFIKAAKGNTTLFAVLPDASNNLNITPISDVMAKKFAAENGVTPEQLIGNPNLMASSDHSKANDAVALVNAIVQSIASASGLSNVSNPLTQTYTAVSSNPMDKFIQNIQLNTDSSGINFTIPTSTGTVAINIAFTASTNSATASVAAKSAQIANASLSDGDKIELMMGVLLGKLSTCADVAGDKATMIALIEALPHPTNGVKYMNGRTVEQWITKACDLRLPALTRIYSKTLARFGNKIIFAVGAKATDGSSVNLEMAWTAIKTGNSAFQASDTYGGWRIMSDNMTPKFSIKTRHALDYNIDVGSTTKVKYERYIDTWAGRQDGTVTSSSLIPETVDFYAIPLKTMAEKYISSTEAKNYLDSISPTFTLTKTNTANDGSHGCNSWFTLDPTKKDGDCEFFAYDDRSSSFQNLFTNLENNEYTLLVMKTKAANGSCTNCDSDGMPTSFEVLGKAYSITQLFGSNVTRSALRTGVATSQFSTAMDQARTYYAAPSNTDLVSMETKLRSSNMGSSFPVTWSRSKDKRPLNGVWGGWITCNNNDWTELNEPPDATLLTSDTWTYNPPLGKSSFNQASYLSFAFANKINLTEFAFYVTAGRGSICN